MPQTQPSLGRAKHQRGARCIYRDMTAAELDRAIDTNAELLAALKTAETVLSNIAAPFVLKNGEHAIGEARLREIRVALADTTAIIAKCEGR